jgi:glc operon protein GlcG
MVACRMYGLLFVLLSGLALGAPWPSVAQQATPPYGAPISLEQAKKIIAAAEAEAQKNNWPVVITVVDTGGHVVAVHRLDNTQLGSIAVAEARRARQCCSGGHPRDLRMPLLAAESDCECLGCAGPRHTTVACRFSLMARLLGPSAFRACSAQQDGQIANAGASALK